MAKRRLSIMLIAIGDELTKLLSMLNTQEVRLKCVITVPLQETKSILEKSPMEIESVNYYTELRDILKQHNFDYIIFSDPQKGVGKRGRIFDELQQWEVPSEKIVDLSDVYTMESFPLFNLVRHHIENQKHYSFFITGVSHAYAGTDMTCFHRHGMNLAHTSQDLFLDFHLAQLVLRYPGFLRQAIVAIAPFSLHYDLSQSVNDRRMYMYYPMIHELHNLSMKDEILHRLLNEVYFSSFVNFTSEMEFPHRLGCNSSGKEIGIDEYFNIRLSMFFHEAKRYEKTVEENVNILQEYIELCQKKNVSPYLIIYPVSEWYNRYFPADKFEEVRELLRDCANLYHIPFLDFSNDKRFSMSDFFDVEHLNIKGARKISTILDQLLESPMQNPLSS